MKSKAEDFDFASENFGNEKFRFGVEKLFVYVVSIYNIH